MIKLLPENLVNKIAAGEVVERPASVIKELVENSLDAGAKRIVVEIEKGGKDLMRVTDDGMGMNKEDAKMAFERHATSKISSYEDLFKIQTMGFRGEALSAISAVSMVKMQTKTSDSISGTLIQIDGGKMIKSEECGCAFGTQIEIKNLFYNTPARRKFLKTDNTEYGHIVQVITGIALAYPNIAFKFISGTRTIFDLSASDLKLRIQLLLSQDFAENLLPVFYGGSELKIDGFIGLPSVSRDNRFGQYLLVNKREIKNNLISHAVFEGYHSLLPKGKQPVFVINLEIKPDLVDVNVHPRKLEVKFLNQSEVYSCVKKAVSATLEKNVLAPKIGLNNIGQKSVGAKNFSPLHSVIQRPNHVRNFTPSAIPSALKFTEEIIKTTRDFNFDRAPEPDNLKIKPLVQVANAYLIGLEEEGITIIDQHAAHERIMYAQLMANYESQKPVSQSLLLPLTLEFSYREVEVLQENLPLLQKLGFEIENFGGNTFTLTAIPACLIQDDISSVIKGVIDDLLEEKPVKEVQDRKEKVIHYLACRSAVKFGKSLTSEEQKSLLKKLQDVEQKYTCPHGRPTMIKLTFEELEKKFGRKS